MTSYTFRSFFVLCIYQLFLIIMTTGHVIPAPTKTNNNNNIIQNVTQEFQEHLLQQNFESILTAIELRLRNLDNIYQTQLSQSLETKLEIYHKKLDNLDMKMMRLESMISLNLDKISENISTKNYKDDVTFSNIYRKIDNAYDALHHRLSNMERQAEHHYVKLHTKGETILTRLQKLEENIMQRDSDMENELSDMIMAMDDVKTNQEMLETKVERITTFTKNIKTEINNLTSVMENIGTINSNTEKMFVDNIDVIKNISRHQNILNDNDSKICSTSHLSSNLNELELNLNSTRTEIQNGIRSLQIQIGKIENKNNKIQSTNNDDIERILSENFEKILTNQDSFLESCHRVQMDESQIESEISDMLNKLVDMLEKKITNLDRDLKNLEKTVSNHDNRINRNMYQTNTNVVSLYEKTVRGNEHLNNEIKKLTTHLHELFNYIQEQLSKLPSSTSAIDKIQELTEGIESIKATIKNIGRNSGATVKKLESHIQSDIVLKLLIKNITETLNAIQTNMTQLTIIKQNNLKQNLDQTKRTENMTNESTNDDTKRAIEAIFGNNPYFPKNKTGKCQQNYGNLIDVRSNTDCSEENEETATVINDSNSSNKCKQSYANLIDVRNGFVNCTVENPQEPQNVTNTIDNESSVETTTEYEKDYRSSNSLLPNEY